MDQSLRPPGTEPFDCRGPTQLAHGPRRGRRSCRNGECFPGACGAFAKCVVAGADANGEQDWENLTGSISTPRSLPMPGNVP